jgi:hypothetical protein
MNHIPYMAGELSHFQCFVGKLNVNGVLEKMHRLPSDRLILQRLDACLPFQAVHFSAALYIRCARWMKKMS